MKEKQISVLLAEYLQLKHPNVIYRFDLAADLKMTIGQARRNKLIHPHKGHPDLFVSEPRGKYCGLYLELKAEDASPFLKGGGLSQSQHIQQQARYLHELRDRGYQATFSVGLDRSIKIVDRYLALPITARQGEKVIRNIENPPNFRSRTL